MENKEIRLYPRSQGLARWRGPHRDIPGMCKFRAPAARGCAVALRCPGGGVDRCHTPDKKLSIPLMDKHRFGSLYRDGTAHSELKQKRWEVTGTSELPLPELCHRSITAAAPPWIPVRGAQPAVSHTPGVWECMEGKADNSRKMQREKKKPKKPQKQNTKTNQQTKNPPQNTSKKKRSSCRKTLAAQSPQNHEVSSGTSDPNGFAPFHLFIP